MSRALMWAALLCTGLAVANPVSASGWQGSYSNVCVHPQSGDLLGAELSWYCARKAVPRLRPRLRERRRCFRSPVSARGFVCVTCRGRMGK